MKIRVILEDEMLMVLLNYIFNLEYDRLRQIGVKWTIST